MAVPYHPTADPRGTFFRSPIVLDLRPRQERVERGSRGGDHVELASIRRLASELTISPFPRLQRDKERSVYGLKEQALAKCYVRVLGLDPKKTEAGRRLVSWKQPTGRENVSPPIFVASAQESCGQQLTPLLFGPYSK